MRSLKLNAIYRAHFVLHLLLQFYKNKLHISAILIIWFTLKDYYNIFLGKYWLMDPTEYFSTVLNLGKEIS